MKTIKRCSFLKYFWLRVRYINSLRYIHLHNSTPWSWINILPFFLSVKFSKNKILSKIFNLVLPWNLNLARERNIHWSWLCVVYFKGERHLNHKCPWRFDHELNKNNTFLFREVKINKNIQPFSWSNWKCE